jgi:hypothetical protein
VGGLVVVAMVGRAWIYWVFGRRSQSRDPGLSATSADSTGVTAQG